MEKIAKLRCVKCAATYREGETLYTCPVCGIEGIIDIEYNYEWIKEQGFGKEKLKHSKDKSIWRYLDLLPLPKGIALPSLEIGPTPLLETPRLAKRFGIKKLWIKDDGRLPTASFKDRASSVAVVKARSLGLQEIACASTGNAASSLAGWSAHLGLRSYIFVPQSAPEAKVVQLRIYGSTIFVVKGNYDQTWDLCQHATEIFGWYNRNAAVNPVMVEGKKTCGLEIAEQLGDDIPDWVSVSIGDGCTISGIWKGFCEMKYFGIIPKLPKLIATQAQSANPVERAFQENLSYITPQKDANTLADSISVGHPRNARKALRAVRESQGTIVSVTDEKILEAIQVLASQSGIFAEPAGAAGLAGIEKAREEGIIQKNETVLHVVTGNGLKDIQSADKATQVKTYPVHTIEDVQAIIKTR